MRKKCLLFIILSLLFLGCKAGSKPAAQQGNVFKEEIPNKEGSIIEIPVIAKLSPDELSQKLGAPESEGKQDFVSGRTYSLNNGEAEMNVEFDKNGGIKEIEIVLKTRRDSPEQVLKAAGFDLGDSKPDWENTIVKEYKERVFNGIRFKEIRIEANPPTQKWDRITVIIKR